MKKMLMVLLMLCLMCAGSAMAESVSYIERSWNNSLKTVVGATNTLTDGSYTPVTAETTTWENGKWYVAQGNVTIDTRVTVNGTANLILCDDAALTVNGGIKVGTGTALVIYGQSGGTGALTASSTYDAGIGGGQGSQNGGNGGTVTVYGGEIHASSTSGAGIGGGQGNNGDGGDGGTVTVYGGEIHASSDHGAGIGGGEGYKGAGGAGGTVTVYGGEVHASSDHYSAGIGGGQGRYGDGGAGGNVTIEGGVVYATGNYGAGIGGGSSDGESQTGGNGGTVTISGGTVYATGDYGAGIGGGSGRGEAANGGAGGNVTISGGTVYATGDDGAGIGGSRGGDSNNSFGKSGIGGTVMISGGVVYATGINGAGIGGGYVCHTKWNGDQGEGGEVTISGGTVYAASRNGINNGTKLGGFGIGAGYYRRTDGINPDNKDITIAPQNGKTIVVKQSVKDAELDGAEEIKYPANGSIGAKVRDKVFYAYTCDANNTGTYRLEFVANGGDAGSMYPLRLPKGQATSLPSCGFTRTGYTFTGWNTQADGSGRTYMLGELVSDLQPGDNGEVVTLYAQWRPNTYTVTFRDNSGTVTIDDLECTYDQEITLPGNTFTRPGYTFIGWRVGGELLPESVTNLTAEDGGVVQLKAEWTANTYTVKFDKNAGDAIGTMADQVLTYNDKKQQLSYNRFKRAGYTFDGWNTQENGKGTAYANRAQTPNVTTVNNGVVTLYAQWKPNTYTVEFNANYGTGTMDSQEFTYDDEEQALTENAYTRINYFFAGWNTEEDGSGAAYADGAQTPNVTAENGVTVTLYAQWQALPIGNDNVETQLLNEALTAEHLSGMPQGYNTLADVEAQMRGAAAQMGFLNGAQDGFIELRDVRLQQREKGDGAYWIDVPKENFPAAGLTVTLEIPEGADVLTHDFLVVHMFTQEMNGRLPGAMEAFTPAIGEDGLTVTLNGCSPVGILWRVKPVDASALPQTGDTSSLMGWVCLLTMCAGAALVMKRARA